MGGTGHWCWCRTTHMGEVLSMRQGKCVYIDFDEGSKRSVFVLCGEKGGCKGRGIFLYTFFMSH